MRMPVMDGATLLGHVKDMLPDTARLILSGYSDIALAKRAIPVAHRVLAKPCSGTELEATIQSLCSLQELLCAPSLRRLIGAIGELPSLSSTYTGLLRVTQDPNTSLADVAAVIETDVAMAAKVLQLVNSGFFGLAQSISSLQWAIGYLGMETMRNLALASDTFRVFIPAPSIPLSFLDDLHRHAQRSALIAGTLPLPLHLRDLAIIAALLHDIGELVLACKLPRDFLAARERMSSVGCSRVEAEEQIIATSHAEIGAYLLGLWGIDSVIVEAVAHHHRPSRIPHVCLDVSTAVYLADRLAHDLTDGENNRAAADTTEFDAVLQGFELAKLYPEFREKAMEQLAQREGV
jgi:HD-like signal output (HDOD) protein